ncbi:cytochrome d ubiquinol oxidase subunit II [Legionella qingyii]|uniref:Cytochrome d ubiquinol oxidase subunit II n=1 Tax=Legionella qingyii TaxID=2184757 RepID=A0A317TY57_9GAMM|nr:cytochrome d ubiquinol oxidase subunit II [Legionella qingyii]PWY54411.1 cytochrome d ubiquinol oxidase subunit II [Legionella qingyii]RUR22859.1 cytochrome d ubiquinol oxidase subunit II [Legionella qingyii]RUR22993.1 cytochrome d ubiquinol oxidase subunit II [Legionella qingyii]
MILDYETLRVIWWLLLGVLLIGFAIMDGFDLGVAIWLPWFAKTDTERRILINTVGPTWEGNQVWFILGGGAIFAAWPDLYSLSFSGFYLAMLVVLLSLILRPVGFKYRSKLDNPLWRSTWDWLLFVGGFVPALIFGVAVGNVLQGVPFYYDDSLRVIYTGTFFQLLNPYALCCGVLSVLMLAMHGAFFIQIKTEGSLQKKARNGARYVALLMTLLFILMGFWTNFIDGYVLNNVMPHDGPSNPLYKEVNVQIGAWFTNYRDMPISLLVPLLSILCAWLAILLANKALMAFILSSISVGSLIATVGISMFPFILPSSTHPKYSLMVWDSSSSQTTLFIMLIATVIFLPIVLAYTAWVYRVLRGKVNEKTIKEQTTSY